MDAKGLARGGGISGVSLRAETPLDEPFLFVLFASTRQDLSLALAAPPAAIEALLRIQHMAQRRAHDSAFPQADRSIIVIDGEPRGRLCVDRAGAEIRIVDIALLPDQRGAGVGTAILNTILDEARRGGRAVALQVARDNPAARLYERLGFTRTGGSEVYHEMEWRSPRPR